MASANTPTTSNGPGSYAEEDEPLDVLDLPQLYTKPTAQTLLSTLADLSHAPPSWETTPRSGTRMMSVSSNPIRRRKVKSEGLAAYLTGIISNPLVWIHDDDEKEQIWEAASQRLSERSGRTAMGAMTRSFSIPLSPVVQLPEANGTAKQVVPHDFGNCVSLAIHEPALTADNLGLKTWASSYLLAKRLYILRAGLPPLPESAPILELGAGTGLVGMAASCVFQTHVVLTDLPEIVENLDQNVRSNAAVISACNGTMSTAILDWADPGSFHLESQSDHPAQSFPLILVADPIYSTEHPRLLVQAIGYHLVRDGDASVVIELPLRDAFAPERQDLRERMTALGLTLLYEGEEVGFDDWSDGQEDTLAEVRCWWSVWGWTQV